MEFMEEYNEILRPVVFNGMVTPAAASNGKEPLVTEKPEYFFVLGHYMTDLV